MRFVVDSDIFLHALLHTDRGEESRDFIDKYTKEISTTALNLMEIGSVLSRKYRWRKETIDDALEIIRKSLIILIPTEYDMIDAMDISLRYYLTPIDALMLTIAKAQNLTLMTYDRELLGYSQKGFDVKSPLEL